MSTAQPDPGTDRTSEPWYVARDAGVEQTNPAHLSNCRDCYGTAPAKHVENPPTWTASELAEMGF